MAERFSIGFDTGPTLHFGEQVAWGHLDLRVAREEFASPISFWSKQDYLHHWKAQLIRVLGGRDAALVVKMRDPATANFIETWTCYPEGSQVILRNRLVMLDSFGSDFSVEKLDQQILPRRSDRESSPSEWAVSREAMAGFVEGFDLTTN
jgi:hypothetical protein